MADTSKRAKTSVPRTRGQTTSKAETSPEAAVAKTPVEPKSAKPPVERKSSAKAPTEPKSKAPAEPKSKAPAEAKSSAKAASADAKASSPKATAASKPKPPAERKSSAKPPAEAKVPAERKSSAKPPAEAKSSPKTPAEPKSEAAKASPAEAKAKPKKKPAVTKPKAAPQPIDEAKAVVSSDPAPLEPPTPAQAVSPGAPPPPPAPASAPPPAPKKKQPEKKKTTKVAAIPRPSSLPLKQYEFIGVPSFKGQTIQDRPAPPVAPPPALKQLSLEERLEAVQARLERLGEPLRKQIQNQLDMSWIYHDSALEGVVYSFQELKTALGPDQTLVQESNLQPVIDEIRRHRAAIEVVRDSAKKKAPITVDLIKKIYLTLHPEEGDLKTVKYRKDIPQHRLYFHDYAPPDKIAVKVRQVVEWLEDPETQKGRNTLRVAARAHYDLLRAFPFQTDSGKVARLFMNLLLLQAGYEPAIIHTTERQRYYDALKGSATTIIGMVVEAEENAVMSFEKLLDDVEARHRGLVG